MKQSLILVTILLGFADAQISGQSTFKGTIVDANTGSPLVTTVSIINEEGNVLKPDGQHDHVFYLGKKRWYIEGDFTITNPDDILHIEIRRGLETLPLLETIDLSGEKNYSKEFRLHCWVDMKDKGYLSGDSHIHYLKPKTTYLHMQGEDLQVANLLTSDFTNDVDIFTGGLDDVSTDDYFVYVGQEIRDWQLGHANLLDLKQIVQPLEPFGGSLSNAGSNPNLLLSPRLEESHQQRAANIWAHFSNLPGLESAVAFPLGLIDAVELMTYDDPTMLPSHWTAWDYSDLQLVEFPPLRGMDLYYQYLNAGFNLPITSGTDKMGDNIPVGSNRNYVRIEGDMNYESWVEGLKKGRGFVTNGPLITFTVDGHHSGETIHYSGDKTVKVSLKAESLLPFGRLEIVANGKTLAWKYLEHDDRKGEIYSAELELEMQLMESTWIAGRVTSLDKPQMLPRNLTVFAHSNPVYFILDQKAIRVIESVDYLLDYLKSGRKWINNYANFTSSDEKAQAIIYFEKAEKVIRELRE